MDSRNSVAEAVAIRDGFIVKVGSDAEVLASASKNRRVHIIDLHGHTATPGLVDTHAHIAQGGVAELYDVKLSDATSIAEIISRIKAQVAMPNPANGSPVPAGMRASLSNAATSPPSTLTAFLRTIPSGFCIQLGIMGSLIRWL